MDSTANSLNIDITDAEFAQFQKLIYDQAGISLSPSKKVLLVGRLTKRLKHWGLSSFGAYYRMVMEQRDSGELQMVVDLLTTNETFFFREPRHFDFLKQQASQYRSSDTFRVWSAASSTGEEAYSTAMVLAETLASRAWEIVGTDISTRVLSKAETGLYSLDRTDGIPPAMLKKYCLKGTGEHDGKLLISKELRDRVRFYHANLVAPRKDIGQFDLIFLRNVMIYFDQPTKRKVVSNLLSFLKPQGHLLVGHSESLHGLTSDLVSVQPTVYRRAST